jgi:hypothetical protein
MAKAKKHLTKKITTEVKKVEKKVHHTSSKEFDKKEDVDGFVKWLKSSKDVNPKRAARFADEISQKFTKMEDVYKHAKSHKEWSAFVKHIEEHIIT